MRKIYLIALLITSVPIVSYFLREHKNPSFSRPTEQNEYQRKKEWIESIHGNYPGWEEIEINNREQILDRKKHGIIIPGRWFEVGSKNQSGRIHLSEISPLTGSMYIASAGGNIWKSTLDGASWKILNDFFPIGGIHFLRLVPHGETERMLVASSGSRFYYSDNDGISFEAAKGLSSIDSWGGIQKVVIQQDSIKRIFLLSREWDYSKSIIRTGLYQSVNLGESFTLLHYFEGLDSHLADVWCDYYQFSKLYFLRNREVFLWEDGYLRKLAEIISPTATLPKDVRITGLQKDSAFLSALMVYDSYSEVYFSSNQGKNWTYKAKLNNIKPFMTNSFSCSSTDPSKLYLGSIDCYVSSDSGNSWKTVNGWAEYYQSVKNKLHADIPGINSFRDSSGKELVLIGTDGGVYSSNDQLNSVTNLSLSGLNISQYYSTCTNQENPNIIHAGSQDQGYQRSDKYDTIGPTSFRQFISGDYGHLVSGDNGKNVWMVYPDFLLYTRDFFGPRWNFAGKGQLWMPPIAVVPGNPDVIYYGGGTTSTGTHLFKISYSTGKITHQEYSFDFSIRHTNVCISAIAVSPINKEYIYLTTNIGSFFYSTDNGQNWGRNTGFLGPPPQYFYGNQILPSGKDPGKLYLIGSGYKDGVYPIYVSGDHGKTFTPFAEGLPKTAALGIAMNEEENMIALATESGPYLRTSLDNSWNFIGGEKAPVQAYWCVEYVKKLKAFRFGTYGRGIWDFFPEIQIENFISKEIRKEPMVFPNPAEDIIQIRNVNPGSLIRIIDQEGRIYAQVKADAEGNTMIHIENLMQGLYFIQTRSQESTFVLKFIRK